MHLFYDPTINSRDKTHTLSEEESKHACRVLRLKEGDEILLLNGNGFEFLARISDSNPKNAQLKSFHLRKSKKLLRYSHCDCTNKKQ